jgi:hypothetical protein
LGEILSSADLEEIKKQLSGVVGIINPIYIRALLQLHEKLCAVTEEWVVGGKLGEALRVVQVEPDGIDLVTSEVGANLIFRALNGEKAGNLAFQTQKLPRDAEVNGNTYPIYLRSIFFESKINNVPVRVYGDVQLKVNDWEWGDKLEFTPEYVCVAGAKIAFVPLQFKVGMFTALGWSDRVEKIKLITEKKHSH